MNRNSESARCKISKEYARWADRSALRSGAPIKSEADVNKVLAHVESDFCDLFDQSRGPIDKKEFEEWHAKTNEKMKGVNPKLQGGWAAKMIAIYLKTVCYMAGYGREGLLKVMHPPIDNRLICSLKSKFPKNENIWQGLRHFKTIKGMDEQIYADIVDSFKLVAKECDCTLFEVEQHWQ